MFGRRLLAAATLLAVYAQGQTNPTITNPSPTSWWVSGSTNTLAWTCNPSTNPSAYTVVVSNTDHSILAAPQALVANVPDYDCSYTINQQQSSLLTASTTWTLALANIVNVSDVYASVQFTVEAAGSAYPATTSAAASGSGTATSSGSSASSTSSSKTGAASTNYIPVGMSMVAALILGSVVA